MKRIFACLICVVLLFSAAPSVFAAGSASLSGPSVVRAGDTITLSFTAGGGIYGGSGVISYDSSQLTLQSYSQSIGGSWAVEFNGNNFVFYDNSMASPIISSATIFQAVFTVNSSLAAGTGISVTASGVTLSDGKQDTQIGSRTYSATIAPPLSGNCNLASLTVSNATISPAFSPSVTKYSVSVPYSVSSLAITATAEDANAKVSVNNPTLTAASTTNVTITVTAENGATKTYTISAKRAQDPNYVKSSNANLGSLSVEGYSLSPAFSADVTQYYIWLPYETETITIDSKAESGKASVAVSEYAELTPGEGTDIAVTVTAEDGTQLSYTITAFRAPAHEDVEAFLEKVAAPVPEPTEPPTEPATEPTTEPTTAPTTEPATQPPTEPAPQDASGNGSLLVVYILGGLLCAAVGAAAAILVMTLLAKKRKAADDAPAENTDSL